MTTANPAAFAARPARTGARPLAGLAAIAVAIGFNVPFSMLAASYDYPDVLRRPAGEALDLFAAGGPALILTWHAFALTAFALIPLAAVLMLTKRRLGAEPGLAIAAALAGALAGLAQAIGLWRWVFVIPALARAHADPAASETARLAAENAFVVLNQYGGVAIGEHLGQLLLALFVALAGALQWREARRFSAAIGFVTALAIFVGTGEGLAIAMDASGELFSFVTIGGFAGLTLWLIATGVGEIRGQRA